MDLAVAVDDALYVRGYNGPNSRWYQAAVQHKAGRIISAGITKEVAFEPVDGPINDASTRPTGEVRWQPVPQADDRRTSTLRDSQGHAAGNRNSITVSRGGRRQ